jgi:hypothetical protein
VRFGQGQITVVGFGRRFSDANMGVTPDVEPGEEMKRVFDYQYRLLKKALGSKE